MDYVISWGAESEDVCITTSGGAATSDLDRLLFDLTGDLRWRPGLNVLVDHRLTSWSTLTVNDIEVRAALLELRADRIGRQRIAIVLGTALDFGIVRSLMARVDGRVHFTAHVFRSISEARAWLRGDVRLLVADVGPLRVAS